MESRNHTIKKMGRIKLLDCTLRDGGYINNWNYGHDAIKDMTQQLTDSKTDIVELGFLKDEPYDMNRTVFNSMEQVKEILPSREHTPQYAVMIEVVNPIDLNCIEPADGTIDIVRVIVWKRLLREGFEYCKGIVEKGYKLCVQPARVDQYSENEFIEMIETFNVLNPMAIYIVDSWGTMYSETIMKYFKLADKHLLDGIAMGYHGHNNMMQAFDIAKSFIDIDTERDRIIDASIYGIGRGAGNLNSEIIAKYMNASLGTNYEISFFLSIYYRYIKEIFLKMPWGYSIPYFLTAVYNCNPSYATYYAFELEIEETEMEGILKTISAEDKIIYTQKKAMDYLNRGRGRDNGTNI